MTVDTKEIVTTIGYMIGVKKNILEQCFGEEYHELLQTLYVNKETSIIRYLCKLRTTLMQKFKKTDDEMRFNLKNLNSMDFYDQDNIKQLEKWGFEIIKPNYRSEKYMLDLAGLISANIDNCFELFPDWVNWNYIKDLFVIPQYTKKGVLKSEFNIYMKNIEYYPFQMYIHWKPEDHGSILYTDGKFLGIIYRQHNDIFTDFTKYKDAHSETKNNIVVLQ